MQVLCIESPLAWHIIAGLTGAIVPQVGDFCTVTNTRICNCGQHDVYDFSEFNLSTGFQTDCFAALSGIDAEDIDAAEQEAIVPAPMHVESDPRSIEEKALSAYFQIYELTGCEQRAAAAYFEILNARS